MKSQKQAETQSREFCQRQGIDPNKQMLVSIPAWKLAAMGLGTIAWGVEIDPVTGERFEDGFFEVRKVTKAERETMPESVSILEKRNEGTIKAQVSGNSYVLVPTGKRSR